jgi:hypothetical protein
MRCGRRVGLRGGRGRKVYELQGRGLCPSRGIINEEPQALGVLRVDLHAQTIMCDVTNYTNAQPIVQAREARLQKYPQRSLRLSRLRRAKRERKRLALIKKQGKLESGR